MGKVFFFVAFDHPTTHHLTHRGKIIDLPDRDIRDLVLAIELGSALSIDEH